MFKWFLLLFYLLSSGLMAQEGNLLQLKIDGIPPSTLIKYQKQFEDSLSVYKEVSDVLNQLQFKGYFYADTESGGWEEGTFAIRLVTGESFRLLALKNGNVPQQALSEIRFKERLYKNVAFDLVEINQLKERLLIWYENNGFPFAKVWLDSFAYNNNRLSASIFAEPGEEILIHSIRITGSAKLNSSFIETYLGLKPNRPYQEQRILELDKRIAELPFVKTMRNSEVEFVGNKAKINLFLDRMDANQFDGLIGFLPNQTTGKLQLTGDFRLRLLNALKQGETLAFNYKGLPQQTQELDLSFNYPYVFKSALGVGLDFALFKQDTAFINISNKIALVYNYKANHALSFFVDNQSSRVIGQ
ncbi:hypothetical protein EIM50_22380, partial [Pseudoxanthomonas sp. SGD-10]